MINLAACLDLEQTPKTNKSIKHHQQPIQYAQAPQPIAQLTESQIHPQQPMVKTPLSESRPQEAGMTASMRSPSSYNDEAGAQSVISELGPNNQSVTINKGGANSESEVNTSVDVIDHMARLDFKVKPEGGTLISFDYEYNDYLDECGCVDPKTLKEIVKKP